MPAALPWYRFVLPWIVSAATGQARYLPKIEWSEESWTHNAFRAWEYIAFRKYGVRPEATTTAYHDEEGRVYVRRAFHSVEALIAHTEAMARVEIANTKAFILGEDLPYGYMPRPLIAGASLVIFGVELHLTGNSFVAPFVIGAVANDAATSSTATNGTSFNYSHTATGSDRAAISFHNTQAGDVATGVTYNSVSMTQVTKLDAGSTGWYGFNYVYKLVAPSTGSQSVAHTASSSGWMRGCVETFTGCDQTDPVDSYGSANVNGTSNKPSITIIGSGVWICSAVMWDNSTPAQVSGALITKRAGTGADFQIGDSNGTVSAGTYTTYGWTLSISAQRSTVFNVGVQPPVAVNVTVNANLFSFAAGLYAATVTAIRTISVAGTLNSAAFTIPAPTITATRSVDVSPTMPSASFATQAPTITATRSVDVTPSVPTASFTMPAPNIITPDAQVNASMVSATFTIPAYTPIPVQNIVVSPDCPTALFAPLSPSISGGATISPSAPSASFTTNEPVITAIRNESVAPSVVTATFTLPSSTVSAETNAVVLPSVVTATFTIPSATVAVIANIVVSPAVLTAHFTAVHPQRVGGVWTMVPKDTDDWGVVAKRE